jgi:hypothetical protein
LFSFAHFVALCFTHTMQRLQVKLIGSLRCYKLHRRALDGLCDRLCITKVVLLSF